jgi:hypothetical protein
VKQGDLGEYEEMQEKKVKYTIYKAKASTPPQAKPQGWQTPHFKLKRVITKT